MRHICRHRLSLPFLSRKCSTYIKTIMKNTPKLMSTQLQKVGFITLIESLKYRLEDSSTLLSSIRLYTDPGINTITCVPDLFQSCILLVIKQAFDAKDLDNHIELAFFYRQQGIYFVPMHRQKTYEQAPFTELNQMPDQSLKALKKAGGTLQMLKIGEERYYPSFRFDA